MLQHKPTRVKAGQEIDVTWGAMGHAGGYVRLSLAPKWWLTFDVPERNDGSGDGNDTIIFSSNVVKYDCFGGGAFTALIQYYRTRSCVAAVPVAVPHTDVWRVAMHALDTRRV